MDQNGKICNSPAISALNYGLRVRNTDRFHEEGYIERMHDTCAYLRTPLTQQMGHLENTGPIGQLSPMAFWAMEDGSILPHVFFCLISNSGRRVHNEGRPHRFLIQISLKAILQSSSKGGEIISIIVLYSLILNLNYIILFLSCGDIFVNLKIRCYMEINEVR